MLLSVVQNRGDSLLFIPVEIFVSLPTRLSILVGVVTQIRRVRVILFSDLLLLLHDCLVALSGLVLVLDNILLLKLTHALDLVKVNHETFIVSMQRLDALTAEDVQVIRAVEVLDALGMLLTKLL